MARNEETLDIVTYAERLPEDLTIVRWPAGSDA